MSLGKKLQELRKQQSLSQDAFAEIMGVSRQSVSKWELDQSYPTTDKLVEIADYFNISLDDMLRNGADSTNIITNNNTNNESNVIQKNDNKKDKYWYFIWWAVLAILIMILFGIKEYFAGFVISQILVWSTAIYFIFKYIKSKTNNIS